MKKLITLLLVLTGCVMTATAKTFYVKNNCNWGSIYLYAYGEGSNASWPGVQVTSTVKVDADDYYIIDIGNYNNFIIHNGLSSTNETGCNERTVKGKGDVDEGAYYTFEYSNKGWSTDDNQYEKWYNLNKQTVYTYNFSVSNVESISWSYIYLWTGSGSDVTELVGTYPGNSFGGSAYSYNSYSDKGTINVIFNEGSGSGKRQTVDMTAVKGNNTYLIKEINSQYKRVERATTNASGYCTFVNTNPLTIPEETAYYATDNGNGSATAKQITNPEASTPMLIKGTPITSLYFEVAATGESATGNAFHAGPVTGLESNPSTEIYNYILNGDTFYAANGKNVGENKAYLQLSKSAPAGARVLKFDGDDETTGINTVENTQSTIENTAVYNLNGQRIMKPTKGLYIQNGKKYIVK